MPTFQHALEGNADENLKHEIKPVSFPIDRAEFSNESKRTVEFHRPPVFDDLSMVEIIGKLKATQETELPKVKLPEKPEKEMIYYVKEMAAIKAGISTSIREKYAQEIDVNVSAALRSQAESIRKFPQVGDTEALRYIQGALEVMDASLEAAGIEAENRAVLHQQAEALVIKAYADRLSRNMDVTPEVAGVRVNFHKPKADAVREVNNEFTWPTDILGQDIVAIAEALPNTQATAQNRDEILQNRLQNLSEHILGAVLEYNRNPGKDLPYEVSPRATQMARVMLIRSGAENYSDVTAGAYHMEHNLLETGTETNQRHPLRFEGKGIKRTAQVHGTGATQWTEQHAAIESVDFASFEHSFITGFEVVSTAAEGLTHNFDFWKKFEQVATTRLKSAETKQLLDDFNSMAENFNVAHTRESNLDEYGKAIGEIGTEDVLRIAIAVLGKDCALEASPNFKYEVKATVNALPEDGKDIESDQKFQFAQGINMLRRAQAERKQCMAKIEETKEAEERQKLEAELGIYEKEVSFAFLNAVYSMRECDKRDIPSIPRIKSKDEKWVDSLSATPRVVKKK